MTFCGNVLELVEKQKVLDDSAEFIEWQDLDDDIDIDFFIEKSIIPEIEREESILIDAAIGTLPNGDKMALIFVKNQNPNVYGF